jgi:hypothetical protein
VLHGLIHPGDFARSEKAHGGKKPPCVLLIENVGVFSRYIYPIRYVDASVFTYVRPARPLLNTCLSRGTFGKWCPRLFRQTGCN